MKRTRGGDVGRNKCLLYVDFRYHSGLRDEHRKRSFPGLRAAGGDQDGVRPAAFIQQQYPLPSNCVIYVPQNTAEAYSVKPWSQYAIKEYVPVVRSADGKPFGSPVERGRWPAHLRPRIHEYQLHLRQGNGLLYFRTDIPSFHVSRARQTLHALTLLTVFAVYASIRIFVTLSNVGRYS